MIWWLWTAYNPVKIHTFDVEEAWQYGGPEPDVYWLSETAWTARQDNMGLGLR